MMTTEQASPSSSGATGYQRSLEVHRRIEALYPRVEQHAAYFRALMPGDPNLPQPPGNTRGVRLDPMVCAIGIKADTTKQAIVALCELGDGANALALTRVLLENACLLEWLIRGEGRRRLESYVMFMSVQHERIAETIDRHRARFLAAGATGKSDLIRPTVRFGITRSATRKIDRRGAIVPTWEFGRMTRQGAPVSVRGLFGEITDADPSYEYEVLYGALGSDIVHSGPFSLMSIQRLMGNRETFMLQPIPVPDQCTIAVASSNTAMFLVLDSLTEYLGMDLSAELGQLKANAQVNPYD